MEQIPHGLSVALGTLPLLGAGLLVLIVASLAADRDRWIVPGTVAVLMLAAGISAAMEFGPQVQSALASRPQPAVAAAEPATPAPAAPEETPSAGATTPAEPAPAEPAPADNPPAQPGQQQPVGYTPGDLVSVPGGAQQPTVVIARNTGRRTVVVNPNEVPPGQPVPPAAAPIAAPAPTTRPVVTPVALQPAPTATPPVAPPTAPALRPTTIASNRPPELPRLPSSSAVPAAAGTGTIVVKIDGPLVETAQNPSSSAHVMAILDGKEAHARGPSRTSENRKDNDPSQPVLATTYFWENITFTFNNVEVGYHVLMVDSSLDNQGSHRSAMTGSGQDKNDWNGSVEVKAGQTTVVEFGAKNWMNGQLARIR